MDGPTLRAFEILALVILMVIVYLSARIAVELGIASTRATLLTLSEGTGAWFKILALFVLALSSIASLAISLSSKLLPQ
jgi:hypothetical protein